MQKKLLSNELRFHGFYIHFLLLCFFLLLFVDCSHEKSSIQKNNSKSKTQITISEQIAHAVGNRQIFIVTPFNVQQKFFNIVELKAWEPTEHLWKFTGINPKLGLKWVQAEFQPSEPGSAQEWQLLQIALGLVPLSGDFNNLYESLSNSLSKRIGKSKEFVSDSASKRLYWSMGKYWEIWISEGTFNNPLANQMEYVILVRVAVLQGELE